MAENLRPPRWEAPSPYGYGVAIDAMGMVAAPLFAGFAVLVAVELLTNAQVARWPNIAIGLLLLAAFFLAATVQFAFRARQFLVTPAELEAWWPDASDFQREMMRTEQREHKQAHEAWAERARWSYNAGLLVFLSGVFVAFVPPKDLSTGRLLVLCAVALAFAGEFTWIFRVVVDHLAARRRAGADS